MHPDDLTTIGATPELERARLDRIRADWHAKAGHVCPLFMTPRSAAPHFEGAADPALRDGLGCRFCYPPDGRVHYDSRPAHVRREAHAREYAALQNDLNA